MFFNNLHILPIIVASVVGLLVGFVWHAKWAFGGLWLSSKGWSDEHLKQKKAKQSMVAVHIMTFVSIVITAIVLSALFNSLIITGIFGILSTGFLLWLGLIAPVKFMDYLHGGDNLTFLFVTNGYWLAITLIMSLIIGLWS